MLFLSGCALAYISFEHAIIFLKAIGGPSLQFIIDPNSYLGLMLLLMLMYGIAFVFPVLLVSLELAGVVTLLAAAALVAPCGHPDHRRRGALHPDAVTRCRCCCLMVPLIAFYFASILVGKLLGK